MRQRRNRAQLEALKKALYDLCSQLHPLTIRSLFYRAVSAQLIGKSELEYKTVVRLAGQMRKAGQMPYAWLVDAGRFVRRVSTWADPAELLEVAADQYRRDLWADQPRHVEIWTEKDAVVGVIEPVTQQWQVPLYSCRGYASLSLIYEAMCAWRPDKPVLIRYFGDCDPSGQDIPRFIQDQIDQMNGGHPVDLEVCAVTDEQIDQYRLPTRPTKGTDSRAARFEGESVELDAFDPRDLRNLVEEAIVAEIDGAQWSQSEEQEAEDRDKLRAAVDAMGQDL